jgi:hypothetical protein
MHKLGFRPCSSRRASATLAPQSIVYMRVLNHVQTDERRHRRQLQEKQSKAPQYVRPCNVRVVAIALALIVALIVVDAFQVAQRFCFALLLCCYSVTLPLLVLMCVHDCMCVCSWTCVSACLVSHSYVALLSFSTWLSFHLTRHGLCALTRVGLCVLSLHIHIYIYIYI